MTTECRILLVARVRGGAMLDAELYAAHCAPQRLAALEAVDAVWPLLRWPQAEAVLRAGPLRRRLTVLDLGCGPGDTTAWVLAPRLPERVLLVGADAHPGFVQHARLRNSRAGVCYELFDADSFEVELSLLWRCAPFGIVFSFLLLHRVCNIRRSLGNIYKLMAPSGDALFTLIAHTHLYTVYYQMAQESDWKDSMLDVDVYVSPFYKSQNDLQELVSLLNEAGFQVQRCWADQKKFVYNTEEQLKGYLRAVNPFVHRLPDEKKEDFLAEILRRCYVMYAVTVEQNYLTGMKSYSFNYRCLTALLIRL
ncbi:juvenile hormone acid O-methyltransferase-like [Schistocerca cancellata]|uniref:juvenile hormone acid O-methyltransferase-like n=1 Tax=Schistocerca cancellata TaxID=274614 RepID=UPI00211964BE|nr:juvenile hormone acid O-methyltransferase-like [Schistocerca cancellata]